MNRLFLIICFIQLSAAAFAQKKAASIAELTENAYTTITDHEGYLWIGTANGLLRFDGYNVETFRTDRNHPDMFQSNDILTICENTDKDELWIGTKKGAYILSKKDFTVSSLKLRGKDITENELEDKRISVIIRQDDGTYWLSFRNNVFKLDKDANIIQQYQSTWKGENRSISFLVEDSKGCVWAGLWNGGILRIPKGASDFEDCEWDEPKGPSQLVFNKEKQLIEARAESSATHRYRLDGTPLRGSDNSQESRQLPAEELAENQKSDIQLNERILCITQPENQTQWVGTTRGIYKVHSESGNIEEISSDTGPVHDITVCTNGEVFFVNNANGVCKIQNGVISSMAECTSLSGITCEGDSVLWVSSKMGNVFKLKTHGSTSLQDDTIAGNMNGDPVLKVRADQKGRLWILSANKLKEYSTRTGGCKILTPQQLETGEFINLFIEGNGVKVTGKNGSRHVYETRQLGQEKAVSRIAMSAYTLDGRHALNSSDTINTDGKSHALTLFLTAFTYDVADDITFAYRINGGEWNELDKGENTVTFQSIPYGLCLIEAKAKDNYGKWSEPYTIAHISHPRPWYAYLWIPLILLAVAAIAIFYNMYRKRQKALYAARIRKYESEKDELQRKLSEAEKRAEEIGYRHEDPEEEHEERSPIDQQFLDKAKKLIIKNLSNLEYSVDSLSSDLCMSRMSLYRRIKDILKKSPTDLIRETRLEHAEMLLKTTDYSINEISDLCGFSYPSYFTKCFKERYGKAPKEYR